MIRWEENCHESSSIVLIFDGRDILESHVQAVQYHACGEQTEEARQTQDDEELYISLVASHDPTEHGNKICCEYDRVEEKLEEEFIRSGKHVSRSTSISDLI